MLTVPSQSSHFSKRLTIPRSHRSAFTSLVPKVMPRILIFAFHAKNHSVVDIPYCVVLLYIQVIKLIISSPEESITVSQYQRAMHGVMICSTILCTGTGQMVVRKVRGKTVDEMLSRINTFFEGITINSIVVNLYFLSNIFT